MMTKPCPFGYIVSKKVRASKHKFDLVKDLELESCAVPVRVENGSYSVGEQ